MGYILKPKRLLEPNIANNNKNIFSFFRDEGHFLFLFIKIN